MAIDVGGLEGGVFGLHPFHRQFARVKHSLRQYSYFLALIPFHGLPADVINRTAHDKAEWFK